MVVHSGCDAECVYCTTPPGPLQRTETGDDDDSVYASRDRVFAQAVPVPPALDRRTLAWKMLTGHVPAGLLHRYDVDLSQFVADQEWCRLPHSNTK